MNFIFYNQIIGFNFFTLSMFSGRIYDWYVQRYHGGYGWGSRGIRYAKDELDNTQGRNEHGEEPSKDEAGQARDLQVEQGNLNGEYSLANQNEEAANAKDNESRILSANYYDSDDSGPDSSFDYSDDCGC